MKHILLTTLILLPFTHTHAHPPKPAPAKIAKKITCRQNEQDISFALTRFSAVIDPEEEEFGYNDLWFIKGKTNLKYNTPKAYSPKFIETPKGHPGHCPGFEGYFLNKNLFVLPMIRDNRPHYPFLRILFLNPNDGQILGVHDSADLIEKLPKAANILVNPSRDGLLFRSIGEGNFNYFKDYTVHGQKLPAKLIELQPWHSVALVGLKVESKLDREQTWMQSGLQAYFPSQVAFEEAFALKGDSSAYGIGAYLVVTSTKGPCIYPLKNGSQSTPKNEDWICRPSLI